MAYIDYEPIEGADFGTGYFTHESGKKLPFPIYDPLEAQRLLAQKQAQDAVPDAGAPPAPEEAAAAGAPPPAPEKPAAPPPVELPEGSTRLKDAEATTDMRKRAMEIVNKPKDYPMGTVVPMGDGLYGRVEHHTWTNKDGKRVPGHFRGVTLYRSPEPQPTSEEESDAESPTSFPGDVEQGPPKAPVSKADVAVSTNPEAVAAKQVAESRQLNGDTGEWETGEAPAKAKVDTSMWSPDEVKAFDAVKKKFPNLTVEGMTNMFAHETGPDLSPTRRNDLGYGGLFQLQPSQEKKLVPGGDITKLSRADQIRLYGDYLTSHNAPKDITDSDLGVLQAAPNDVGKPDDAVVYKKGSPEWEANPAWRSEGNGDITIGSIKTYYNQTGQGTTSGPVPGQATPPAEAGPMAQTTQAQTTRNEQSTVSGESVKKGLEFTPEQKALIAQRQADYAANVEKAQAPVRAAFEQLHAQNKAAIDEQTAQVTQARIDEQRARDIHAARVSEIDLARQAVLDDKEPPPFGGNILAGIMAAFVQAAGAYSAAINHTPNQAAELINASLARDSARWKQQHMDKIYHVKDAQELSRDARLELDKAVTDRNILQRQLLDTRYKDELAHTQDAQGQAAAQMLIANNLAGLQAEQQKALQQSQDQVQLNKQTTKTGSTTNSYQTKDKGGVQDITKYSQGPREGQPGRMDLDKMSNDLKTLVKPLHLEFDPTNAGAPFSGTPGGGASIPRNPLTGAPLGEYSSLAAHPIENGLETVQNMTGLNINPWHENVEERKHAMSAMNKVLNARMYLLSGKAINEREAVRLAREVQGRSYEDQIKELNELWAAIEARKAALAATYPGAKEIYDKRYNAETEKAGLDNTDFTPGVQ